MKEHGSRWGDPDCVVLDIGGTSGALVVCADTDDEGGEIEVSPRTAPGCRTHAAFRARRLSRGTLVAACFPALPAGDYLIWPVTGTPTPVAVVGGQVVSIDLVSGPTPRRRVHQ
ncbi:MAG: phospholipase [Candidatus Dormiibacterota bacterium]